MLWKMFSKQQKAYDLNLGDGYDLPGKPGGLQWQKDQEVGSLELVLITELDTLLPQRVDPVSQGDNRHRRPCIQQSGQRSRGIGQTQNKSSILHLRWWQGC